MPKSRRRRYLRTLYWDANCFIALFNNQPTVPPQQLAALRETYDEMLRGRVMIVTSTLSKTEVLDELPAGALASLQALPNFEMVELRSNATSLAGEFRKRCSDAKPKRKLKTPDALHIAAAELARADECWTTDDQMVKCYEAGLLGRARVCLPYVQQPSLFTSPS